MPIDDGIVAKEFKPRWIESTSLLVLSAHKIVDIIQWSLVVSAELYWRLDTSESRNNRRDIIILVTAQWAQPEHYYIYGDLYGEMGATAV